MDQVMALRDYFQGEFQMVLQAPVIFLTAWLILTGLCYLGIRASFRHQFANMQATIDSLKQRLDVIEAERNDYRDKLASISVTVGTTTPDETMVAVKAMAMRLEAVEKMVGIAPEEMRGTNANGSYERFRDGTQVCRGGVSAAKEATTVLIAFPAQFAGSPQVSVYPERVVAVQSVEDRGFSVQFEQTSESNLDYIAVGAWRRPEPRANK